MSNGITTAINITGRQRKKEKGKEKEEKEKIKKKNSNTPPCRIRISFQVILPQKLRQFAKSVPGPLTGLEGDEGLRVRVCDRLEGTIL